MNIIFIKTISETSETHTTSGDVATVTATYSDCADNIGNNVIVVKEMHFLEYIILDKEVIPECEFEYSVILLRDSVNQFFTIITKIGIFFWLRKDIILMSLDFHSIVNKILENPIIFFIAHCNTQYIWLPHINARDIFCLLSDSLSALLSRKLEKATPIITGRASLYKKARNSLACSWLHVRM